MAGLAAELVLVFDTSTFCASVYYLAFFRVRI